MDARHECLVEGSEAICGQEQDPLIVLEHSKKDYQFCQQCESQLEQSRSMLYVRHRLRGEGLTRDQAIVRKRLCPTLFKVDVGLVE